MQTLRRLFVHSISQLIVEGRLTVQFPDGTRHVFERSAGAIGGFAVRDWSMVWRLMTDPTMAFGEGWTDGRITLLDNSTLTDVLDVVYGSAKAGGTNAMWRSLRAARHATRSLRQFNPRPRSRRNVARHYDLNGRLYSLFLDRDRQYSCAYFPNGDETLDEAQAAKKRHIAAKLVLDRPGLTVLDIGCGWGGLALSLAREHGCRVTGITLSAEQLAEAQARAEAEGLSDQVRFELADYRTITRRFDRIVSVGMFEHVGIGHYEAFFGMLDRCLAPDGVALLHAIGRVAGPGSTDPWIARYIFPGGYAPALSEVFAPLERTGLMTTDLEILRLHYAETIRCWHRRFAANRDAIQALYDKRFYRMFELYLAGAETSFRKAHSMVFQLQLTHQLGAVPLTRDYLFDRESKTVRPEALPLDSAGA